MQARRPSNAPFAAAAAASGLWLALCLAYAFLRLPAAGPIPLTLLVQATTYLTSTSIRLIVGGTVRSPVIRIEPLSLLTEEAARFFLLRANAPPP